MHVANAIKNWVKITFSSNNKLLWKANRQTGRQTNRQTDRETEKYVGINEGKASMEAERP